MDRAELLSTALEAVNARPKAYGPPERNFTRISRHWNVYLTGKYGAGSAPLLDAVDVAAMMALMKIARLEETPDHIDSWVDLAGYAACGAECSTAERSEVVEAECATTIEHDPDERVEAPPATRFRVGDKVMIKTDDSREVCEIGAVDVTSDESRRYGLFFEGFPRENPIMAWSEEELEPAGPRFKPGDNVSVEGLPHTFTVHRVQSDGSYSICDRYGSIFYDYNDRELTPA